MSDQRFVTLVTAQPPLAVIGMLAQAAPVPTDGYGGWTTIARPRRKGLTQWAGINPLAVDVTLILGITPAGDAWITGRDVGPDRATLEKMAQPPGIGGEPPLVRVIGAIPHSNLNWVISGFTWDANPLGARDGTLLRHQVTVHLLEYVRDDKQNAANAAALARKAAQVAAAQAARQGSDGRSNQPTRAKFYVVRAGDTLSAIAARLLGSYKRWPEIAKLNGIRDPKTIHVGQRLRLP